jgi:hypothetical protein
MRARVDAGLGSAVKPVVVFGDFEIGASATQWALGQRKL